MSELIERAAQIIAHRACCGTEHNPAEGKLHGFCIVCGVPWPCEYAGIPPVAVVATTTTAALPAVTPDEALFDLRQKFDDIGEMYDKLNKYCGGLERERDTARDERIAAGKRIEELEQQRDELLKDADAAFTLLATMFDAYEDGCDCYEGPEDHAGYCGKAIKLDEADFDAIVILLNKHRPRNADDSAIAKVTQS